VKAAAAGYTHLLGFTKSDPQVTRRLERRMQSTDGDFYRHCVRLGQQLASA
jgi:hypothetical protein